MSSRRPWLSLVDGSSGGDASPPIDRGGGPPHDGGMEARVARLEDSVSDIRSTLGRLEPLLRQQSIDMAEMKGRVAHMPTLFQTGATMLAINAGIVAVAGLIVVLLK